MGIGEALYYQERERMGMHEVNVNRRTLLDRVIENREKHRKKFLKAYEGFTQEVVERLEQSLEDAKAGKKYITSLGISAPQDMTSSYDTVISMLEMCVDETVGISQGEFRQYVLDQWDWTHGWEASNTAYMNKKSLK